MLIDNGDPERNRLCAEWTAGARTGFGFKSSIYRHQEVLAALVESHHGKCCFCEQYVQEDGDVEHFRPKAHYYWLAYEWSNLVLSCSPCNSRHKRNLFPLENEASRATCHTDDLTREEPLFINPCEEDPEQVIEWEAEYPKARDGNRKAHETLQALRLDLRGLPITRRVRLGEIDRLFDALQVAVIRSYAELVPKLKDMIEKKRQDQSDFAAMVRARLSRRPDILRLLVQID